MDKRSEIAERLLQINAIKLSVTEPFTWASGWKSPIYCDNRKSLSFPEVRDLINSEMCELIKKKYNEIDAIAGVATAGIPWGAMVADRLKMPFIYVRPKPKEHGLGNQIEGYYEVGQAVLLIEDLISTGKSSLQVAQIVNATGLIVKGIISIFNYGFQQAYDSFKKYNLAFHSLTDYDALLKKAIEKGIILENDQKTLLNWRKDPANWNVNS